MGRARRIHVRDGVYYVRLQTNLGLGLVHEPRDAPVLERGAAIISIHSSRV